MLGHVREGQSRAARAWLIRLFFFGRALQVRRVSPSKNKKEKKRRKSENHTKEGAVNAVGDNFTALVCATRADHMSARRPTFMENDSDIVCVKLENSYECDHVSK